LGGVAFIQLVIQNGMGKIITLRTLADEFNKSPYTLFTPELTP